MIFDLAVALVAVLAGVVAAVSGFGIGSLLTPAFALQFGTKAAVAAVAIPHLAGTLQRYWILRRHVDRRVLLAFGLTSAAGGLAGALAHAWLSSRGLAVVFGVLLILAATAEATGWMAKVRWGRRAAWIAGALSGAFGGLVGNQGSIRSAAMLGFDVPKESFVATATAIGLFVDAARLPVYLATQWQDIVDQWPLVACATAGVCIGTAIGSRVLERIPRNVFRRIVALLLFALGIYMLAAGGKEP
ncbi:MAG TPA: sulfite exporter TauE/SafE family protein [Usitatibacter sp.]|nr:sulfite exporter TauE/SafE family protein [Usitatibacter sp.]